MQARQTVLKDAQCLCEGRKRNISGGKKKKHEKSLHSNRSSQFCFLGVNINKLREVARKEQNMLTVKNLDC